MLWEGLNTIPEARKGRDGRIYPSLQACTLLHPPNLPLSCHPRVVSHKPRASTVPGPALPWRKGPRERSKPHMCRTHWGVL